jgi:hypothetical protein
MFLGARSTPFSVAEFPFSSPFSKQNGDEPTLGTIPERSRMSAVRRTLAAPRLSERCGKHLPLSSSISDFLRGSRSEARSQQHRSGALDRSTVAIHRLDAACLTRGRLSSGTSLRTWRSPSNA